MTTNRAAGRVLYAQMHLLDRQIQHRADRLVGKVDDLEVTVDESGTAYVTAILCGPLALGPRIGGPLGRIMVAVARRLHPHEDPQPARIDFAHVIDIDNAVLLARSPDELDVERLELWTRDHVIGKIPGAG